MNRGAKAGSVVASLVLGVGLMGMSNAAAHPSTQHMGDMTTMAARGRLPTLKGTVTDAPAITISKDAVPAGRYRIVVDDQTVHHNWHIRGRGVDKKTSVSGTGRTVWRVRLRADTYVIHCDVHPRTMRISLTVT